MTVDGNEIESAGTKNVIFENHYTPRLRKVDHRYGAPGDLLTVTGRIMSKNIGPGAQDLDNFDEIDDISIQNFFLGTAPCDFMDDLGNPYGVYRDLKSNDQYSYEGNFTCKTSGSFIGPQEGQLLVSRYGLSVTELSAYSVNSKGQKFFYHTLPEVSSVSPNIGADAGGTFVTIEGKGFDGYKDNTQVYVNDALCENVEVTSDKLTCKSPAQTDVGASSGGPRGLKYNLWIGEVVDETDIGTAVDGLDTGTSEEFIVDQGFIDMQMSNEETDYTGKLSGLFIAPNSGEFSFGVCANDNAELFLGTSEDPSTKVKIASSDKDCNRDSPYLPSSNDAKVELVQGQNYWIEAVHVHRDSVASNTTNFLQISLRQFNTDLNEKDLKLAMDESQGLYVKSERVLEKQKITIEGLSGADITFTHNGVPSQTPVVADDFASYEENLKTMFKWQCTNSMPNSNFKFSNGFEDPDVKINGESGHRRFWGYDDRKTEPFCGNGILESPYSVFSGDTWDWKNQPLDISTYPKFCFAAKGNGYYDGINVLYTITNKWWGRWDAWVNLNVEMISEDWVYQCVDLMDHFGTDSPNWFISNWQNGTTVFVRRVHFPVDDVPSKQAFIDEISFGKKDNTIERIAPASFSSHTRLEGITVNVTSNTEAEIEFNPYTCQQPEETFQLLGIAGATIDEMTTSTTGFDLVQEQVEYLKSNDVATFSVGGGKVTVERLTKESPANSGTFSLSVNNITVDGVSPYISAMDLQDIFDNELGLAGAEAKESTWNQCFNWDITWDYRDLPGDQPQVEIDASNVINNGKPDTLIADSWNGRQGSVKIIQPGGDFFRLPADTSSDPEITVWVSGFLCKCMGGADCSFSYDAGLTPTIDGVSSDLVDGSIVLTISGSGFTDDIEDFSIDVGGRGCEVTAATASSVTCTLENGPAGDLDISLWVKSKGKAPGAVTYTLSLSIVDFSPKSGSVGGGTTITIEGTGFPNTMEGWEGGNQVTVGGNACKIIETSFTSIKCVTPGDGVGRRRKRSTAAVSITINGQTADASSSYNYDSASTPTITALSTSVGSPSGGETLVITGAMFDYESPFNMVMIGDEENVCEILSWKPDEISCVLPPLSNGQFNVIVKTKSNGFADASQVAPISVDFTLTGAMPLVGSVQGGTKMTITGSGFGNCSNVVFNVGSEHSCVVDENGCTDTEASCTIQKNPTMHVVYNTGRHSKFGPGYVWEPSTVTIRPGDKVRWSWNLPSPQEGNGIAVHSTASATSKEYDGMGYNSMEKSAKGNLIYQFMSEGTFTYNTQEVIAGEGVYMPGKVVVAAPSDDEVVEITASIGAISAETVLGSSPAMPQPSEGCSFADSSCATVASGGSGLEFTFATCITPEITSVLVSSGNTAGNSSSVMGYGNAELTISGSGFSQIACENVVKVGNSMCDVTSASENAIVCNVDATTITSMAAHTVTVNVQNNGEAVQKVSEDSAGKLYVMPKVDTIEPLVGSWAGGSILKLMGNGLNPDDGIVTVNFGEPPFQKGCAIVDVTSTMIACRVPDFRDQKSGDEKVVALDIYFSGQMLRGEIDASTDYTFSSASTPASEAATPTTYSTATDIEVAGSGFGSDVASVSVYLRSASLPSLRKRRSADSVLEELRSNIDFGFGPKPKMVHEFWKRLKREMPSKSITWNSPRSKRNTDKLPHLGPEDHVDELEELFHPEIEHLHARTVKREIDYEAMGQELYESIMENEPHFFHRVRRSASFHQALLRKKRSTEAELLEMSMEGAEMATVTAVTDSSVTFTPPELPAGDYNVIIYVSGSGNADASSTVLTSEALADSISPTAGSTYGGQTVTISGNGFSGSCDDTTVTVGDAMCECQSATAGSVTCVTPAGSEGDAEFVVTSNGAVFPGVTYSYSAAATPMVASVTPSSGTGAQSLTIAGSNFGASPIVTVGGFECAVTASTSDSISCDLPAVPGGDYAIVVDTTEFGCSNNDVLYSSELTATSMSPASGSFGGGSLLTISGTGFDTNENPTVTVCTDECTIESVSDSEIQCRTPANAGSGTEACAVTISQISGKSVDLADQFTYDDALTPQVHSVSPKRGGTGGGTRITITGSGFADSGNKVFIDGSECDICADCSESSTEIVCLTNAHDGCIEVPVTVEVPDQGYGQTPDDGSADFYYIDRWNSIWTWGGTGTPLAGELIHITEGQTILLDTSTPILKMLLIDGGKLMYDRDADGLNLNSEYILIINGGGLEIGTEDEPYTNQATITMHGHVRCTELPIYGCKSIGVREGTLDLHGQFVPMTWTYLAETAEVNDTQIVLKNGVNWAPGSEIVIATTGDRASMGESEKKVIDSVSADGLTITLTEPVKFRHISISQTFGDHEVETRAEVGLLSRNVRVMGNINQQFVTEIPACEKPFVANEEAEQSCFQGKFGEEIGTDEFGAIIFIHAAEINKHLAVARISYTEFTNVGQAFRVGRYPIHFHINGNASTSYVRGNAIHWSFNRACTIHAVDNLLVEHNVAFNVKGLSFFIEDGVEENNIIQYNLAVFTRQSNSLLNPDIQPGSFWIVNPNNIIQHNAAAGSTHFGYWFRVLKNPDGPSRTSSYCPANAPMGRFYNNTAHSCGLYGIWLFTAKEKGWAPRDGTREGGWCDGNNYITGTLGDFTAWNNEIGVEIVEGGAIRFENMTLLDNEKSGIELIHPVGAQRQNGEEYGAPTFKNGVVIGHSEVTAWWPNGDEWCTKTGVKGGWWGHDVENVEFYNFDRPQCTALGSCARCKPKWVSGKTQTSGLSFTNSPNKVSWPWTMSGHYHDLDGTLCGTPDCKVVQKREIYDPSKCVDDTDDEFSHIEGGPGGWSWIDLGLRENDTIKLDGSVCTPDVKFHSVGFDSYAPSSLQFNDVVWHNEFGAAWTPWRKKPPYKDGWAAVLQEGTTNFFFWDTMGHITNITYEMGIFQLADEGDHLLIGHNFTQSPDVFTFNGEPANETSSLSEPPTYDTAGNTDWYWSGNDTKELTYIISHKNKGSRKKRGGKPNEFYRSITFRVYRCLYEGCLPPPPPTVPAGRPMDFLSWSSEDDWASLGLTKPVAGADGIVEDWVTIPPGVWMVMDENPPPLTRMYIYGVLEIDDQMDMELSAEIIMIQGDLAQLVAGYADAPYQNNFNLVLRGNHYTPDQPLPNGPNLGAKALGVFGKLQLHGLDVGLTWTRLAEDSLAGSNTIVLQDTPDPTYWKAGAEIIIAPTGFEPLESEKMVIDSVDGNTVTLTESLMYDHLGSEYSLDDGSVSWKIAAEVGLLTRNIKIIGEDYPEIGEEEFGARVLVAKFEQEGTTYRGYAKISNVEWVRGGQEGWVDAFDARYSLAFINHEDSYDNDEQGRESYVKKCAFNFNYNAAIGLFNTNNVAIEDNVVFRTLEYGLRDEAIGNRWIHNMIVLTRFVGIHKNHRQNMFKRGCFNFLESLDPEFRDNAAAGCERAGFTGTGHICTSSKRWSNNVIHTVQDGIFVNTYNPPLEVREDKDCVVFRGFFIYKAYDYGIYLLTHDTVEMEDNLFVDNGVGIHPFLIRPKAETHNLEYKHLRINNTVFVGRNDPSQCDTGDKEPSYTWFDKERSGGATMWPGRNWYGYSTGHAGLLWPIFSGIGVPLGKPWVNGKPKSFPLLTGQVYLNDITFANFNPGQCDGQFDSAVRTNPRGDDMQFPIFAQNTRFVNVAESSKVWMDRPIQKLVVNEHCVDMHCDGLKKALLVDMDGTFLDDGNGPGTVISDSAYEWEGNPSAGLGYYRIPKTMVTTANGDKIEYADKMPNLGIVRNSQCTWLNEWHAYKCHGINHRLMILESLDIDTLDRRLSPVAVLANPGSGGYIDLINGPQDFSCCFGYACQKRISNFYSIVGTNMMYEVHLTSVPPIQMRFRLNNNDGGDAVLLKIFFQKPQRIDIYVGDQFIYPNNIDLTDTTGFTMLPADDSFIPSLDSQVEGENYFDPTTGFLYLLLRGTAPVDYRIQPSVVTKVGATIDMDNFFEGDVAGNIAALLGIDPANIRVTNIVREGRRKKRFAPTWDNAEDIIMEMAIEPPPVGSNSTASPMSYGDLKGTMAELTNSFQNGSFAANLGASMNISVNSMATQEPLYVPQPEDFADNCIPQDDDPEGDCYLSPENNAQTGIPWSEASQANATARFEASITDSVLQTPTTLVIGSQQPFTANEMSPMNPKPTLYMKDQDDVTVNQVGTEADPWIVTASIATGAGNVINNVTCSFSQGLCVFEDLAIDTMGEGYQLQFELTYPGTEAEIAPVVSDAFDVGGRALSAKFSQLNTLNPVNQTFTAVVTVWDDALDMPADASVIPADITCTMSVLGVDGVELMGTLDVAVAADGSATFSDLQIAETVSNGILAANCEDPVDYLAVALSDPFNVHPYPKTGMVRSEAADFTYSGTIEDISSLLTAFADTFGTEMSASSGVTLMKREAPVGTAAQTYRMSSEDVSFWPKFDDSE